MGRNVEDNFYYFETERNEEIGFVAAGNFLDFILENLGIFIYNKGVDDSLNFLKERFENLELDMEAILKK